MIIGLNTFLLWWWWWVIIIQKTCELTDHEKKSIKQLKYIKQQTEWLLWKHILLYKLRSTMFTVATNVGQTIRRECTHIYVRKHIATWTVLEHTSWKRDLRKAFDSVNTMFSLINLLHFPEGH